LLKRDANALVELASQPLALATIAGWRHHLRENQRLMFVATAHGPPPPTDAPPRIA
jgi:hypothetical protein